METKKMSLANIQGKLTRAEMKKIMAGAEGEENSCNVGCSANKDCTKVCLKCELAPNWPQNFCVR